MPDKAHVLLVAGDPSGDQHAAELATALKQRIPHLKVSALGGTYLQNVADAFLFPLVGIGGFGFWEPLLKLPRLWKARRTIAYLLKKDRPSLVIPVDYYGFNIHVARLAHRKGIPVIYFVSPQVWASRPGRIQQLARVLSKILVIFPFEEALYTAAGLPAKFVGHPLLDRVPAAAAPNRQMTIGFLPGSRWRVAERHLPIMTETAIRLRKFYPQADFVLFRPAEIAASRFAPYLAATPWLRLIQENDFAERRGLWLAISVSGTAALENTLLGIPMVIMYKLSALTYAIARRIIRIPYVAIPNIIAQTAVVPELLQSEAAPDQLVSAARKLLDNPDARSATRQSLLALRARLGSPGAIGRAADEIVAAL
jgi:lipid-A-disaccharide synthase